MAHNVKVKYYPRENTQLKPHSFFAQAIPNGTYGFDQMCEEASKNTSIEAHTIRAAIQEYVKVAKSKLKDGFRVEIGEQFLTLGPSLTAKVKDELNADGTVKRAVTADDLKATGARSRVTAVVNPEFSYEFNRSVRWQKTDRSGNPVETDEDDATLDPDDPQNTGGDGGSEEQTQTGPVLTITKTGTGTFALTDQTGHQIDSGSSVTAGQTLTLSVTPAGSATPTATIGSQTVTLTEDEGQWVGTFQMPATSATLTVRTGGTGDNEE